MIGSDLQPRLKGVNIFLIGPMGVGKSTLGPLLADALNYRFCDTDSLIERIADKPIAEMFASDGETAFRDLESQVLAEVASYTHMVVATGGGVVLRSANWGYLRHGLVVWLAAEPEQLAQRLRQDQTRPLLAQGDRLATLQRLDQERRSLYAQADVCIAIANHSPQQLLALTVTALGQSLRDSPRPEPDSEHTEHSSAPDA